MFFVEPTIMVKLLFSPFQVRAARNLLSAVTRLLILADMIDVHLLLKKLRRVEDDLEHVSIPFAKPGNWTRPPIRFFFTVEGRDLAGRADRVDEAIRHLRAGPDEPGGQEAVRAQGPGDEGRPGSGEVRVPLNEIECVTRDRLVSGPC